MLKKDLQCQTDELSKAFAVGKFCILISCDHSLEAKFPSEPFSMHGQFHEQNPKD